MSWIDKIDVEESLREIISEERQGKDFCLDPLRFQDLSLKNVKETITKDIISKLKSGSYAVKKLINIDVPKSNYILRPASRPIILDWVIYNAIVNFIVSKIYKLIPKNSYSFNRFKDKFSKKRNKKKKTNYWLEFENDSIKLSKNNNYEYLLVTDITSYFEHISLDVLKNRLIILSNDKDYIGAVKYLIENILKKWTEDNKIPLFGLPQGPTASSILADIYLYSVDKAMNENNIKFLRYMDDIRLLSKDISDLKRSIKTLVISLRDLKLNLNAKKTTHYLLNDQKILEEVFDPNRDLLNIIDNIFKKRIKEQIAEIIPSLFSLYEKFKEDSKFSERYLKFFLGKIIDLMKSNIISKSKATEITKDFLDLFQEKHHLSDKLSWFFVASGNYSNEIAKLIQRKLIDFICNKKLNIYEWQEMWALDTIRQLGKIKKNDLKKLKKKVSTNGMCYSQFVLIAGQYGDSNEREDILNKNEYKNEAYRSSLLAIQELNKDIIKKSKLYLEADIYYKEYFDNLKTGKYYGFLYSLENIELSALENIEQSAFKNIELSTEYDTYEY
ncbi:MAG: RNA-directed DNA polymerase [Candidatus Humimicrobiaceae bacterium]